MVYWSSKIIFKRDFYNAVKPVMPKNLDQIFRIVLNKDFQAYMIKKMRI